MLVVVTGLIWPLIYLQFISKFRVKIIIELSHWFDNGPEAYYVSFFTNRENEENLTCNKSQLYENAFL